MAGTKKLTANDLAAMVKHWCETPVNSYLGSDYGEDVKSMLQLPLTDFTAADAVLQKLVADIPILAQVNLGLTKQDEAPDKRRIFLTMNGIPVVDLTGSSE